MALYPSLKAEETATVCAELIITSSLWVESIDLEEVAWYLTLTGNEGSFSEEFISQRRSLVGAKPSITTSEVFGPLLNNKNKFRFLSPIRLPLQHEKNGILATLLHTAIKTLKTHHTYSWKGEVRIQKTGGPIGDTLAQAATTLYLIWWDKTYVLLLDS